MKILLHIVAHGYNFSADELLFLTKTFDSVASGTLELETDDGFNALSVFRAFEDELYEDFFKISFTFIVDMGEIFFRIVSLIFPSPL